MDGHGGGVSLYASVNTEHCVCSGEWRELCDTEAVSWVVEGLALSHRHSAGSERESSRAEQQVSVSLTLLHTAQVTAS